LLASASPLASPQRSTSPQSSPPPPPPPTSTPTSPQSSLPPNPQSNKLPKDPPGNVLPKKHRLINKMPTVPKSGKLGTFNASMNTQMSVTKPMMTSYTECPSGPRHLKSPAIVLTDTIRRIKYATLRGRPLTNTALGGVYQMMIR